MTTKTLIIDDDITTRKVLGDAIEDLGMCAVQSGNGRHGWETLWENPDISLVVTDMMMPDMDGEELIRLIRGNSAFNRIPIVIVSGVANPKTIEELVRLGPCVFCEKPIDLAYFKHEVKKLLES